MTETLIVQRTADGLLATNDPSRFLISQELLDRCDPSVVSLVGDLLTLHLADGDRRYRMGAYDAERNTWSVEKIRDDREDDGP